MSIKGLDSAIDIAVDRAKRTKEAICVVQIGTDEYILWRHNTRANIALMYEHYKIVRTIGFKQDDIRR